MLDDVDANNDANECGIATIPLSRLIRLAASSDTDRNSERIFNILER